METRREEDSRKGEVQHSCSLPPKADTQIDSDSVGSS